MFLKPFKVKSNHQLKASDRKLLKSKLHSSFAALTDDNVEEIIKKKEVLSCVKIETSSGIILNVYTTQMYPLVFEYENSLYPTVYFLWNYPDLIKSFTTYVDVMPKLYGGANLMLPGIVPKNKERFLETYGQFDANMIACVNTTINRAPLAVGVTSANSKELLRHGKGVCLIIYHFLGDKLSTFNNLPSNTPDLGVPKWLLSAVPDVKHTDNAEYFESEDTEEHELASSSVKHVQDDCCSSLENIKIADEGFKQEVTNEIANVDLCSSNSTKVDPSVEMDDLFMYCFLSCLKYPTNLSFPILASAFYKVHMIGACPGNTVLDVKKSSYKKLGNFLSQMQQIGIIQVEEMKPGVFSISSVNVQHEKLINFSLDPKKRPNRIPDNDIPGDTEYIEAYSVTAVVAPLFAEFGFVKTDILTAFEVRKCITDYIKNHDLQDKQNSSLVIMDTILATICKSRDKTKWLNIIDKVHNAMSNCHKIINGNKITVQRGKLSAIKITVATRSGNKKVSLIDNLELFEINLEEFAKECQHGLGASTSINRSTGKKGGQVMVQGNQVNFVFQLLTDKYNIPKKYIEGLENAPKKKK